ncbi:A/G-specific adenine glycosylase [Christiangramia fulva]|uniref:Adenine DNA glycosylase n=1 Tax=Christiangramia fulva TaxID=2126553 RepID=A0A2R3Z2N0_9FLAO|nr:A/G-specific adenine glycosylase [Christiangramia fulva]AVR44507.1 A/G-specific adenine glycosylase [Christiangramia fulva]
MQFSKLLTVWYLGNKRDLPWRKTRDPYKIWLSEIMLQQTRIEQGLPYYLKFIKAFPTVFDLAAANSEQVLKLWQGLGYYSRARNLHSTAKYVAEELKGIFPDNYSDLKKLKGIGDYTASAIASICYDEPVAVVDGNVYRVLSRIFNIHTPINTTAGNKEFKKLAEELLDKNDPATFNQALMEFGALHCKPQNPACPVCPFKDYCLALQKQLITELPVKIKKSKVKKRYFNYLVFNFQNDQTHLEQRRGKGIWRGLYQFPLIESEKLLKEKELISSEDFQEKVSSESFSLKKFHSSPVVHKLSHQHLFTQFWVVKFEEKSADGISFKEIKQYPVPVLIENFLNDFLPDDYK